MYPTLVQVTSLFFMCMFSSCLYVITGFGENITFQILYWTLTAIGVITHPSLVEAVLISSMAMLPLSYLSTWVLIEHVDKHFTSLLWASKTSGALFGALLLVHFGSIWTLRSLGFVFLLTFGLRAIKDFYLASLGNEEPATEGESYFTEEDSDMDLLLRQGSASVPAYDYIDHEASYSWQQLVVAGFIGGFCGGLFGVSGPAMTIFYWFNDIDRPLKLVTTFIGDGFGKCVVNFIYTGLIADRLESRFLPLYLSAVGGSLAGFGCGLLLNKLLARSIFDRLLGCFLVSGSLLIITHKMGMVNTILGCIITVLVFAFVLIFLTYVSSALIGECKECDWICNQADTGLL